MFEEYQKRINDSVNRQAQLQQHQFTIGNVPGNISGGTNSHLPSSFQSTLNHPLVPLAQQPTSHLSSVNESNSSQTVFQVPQRILNPIVFNSSISATPTALSTYHGH